VIILNYSQFSKKTLILGIDRVYFVLLLVLFALVSIVSTIGAILIVAVVYSYSVYLFHQDNYWFDKLIIRLALKKYKTIHKIILGR